MITGSLPKIPLPAPFASIDNAYSEDEENNE